MAKSIAFHLQKGGVGKTSVCGALACQSALSGKRTLMIDCDPQGNLSSWFLKEAPKYELSDVLQGKCFWKDSVVKVDDIDNLYILPTFSIGGSLKNYSETKLNDEPFIIQDLVGELSSEFERIVLDLSPGLGKLERSAIIACNEVITPITTEIFSLDGFEIFVDELVKLKKNYKASVKHNKIIINSFDERVRQAKEIYKEACDSGKYVVYKIPVDPLFRKAQTAHKVPQKYRVNGRGLKPGTIEALFKINKSIWS